MLTALCPDLKSPAGFRQGLTPWLQAHGSAAIPSADLTHARSWGAKGELREGMPGERLCGLPAESPGRQRPSGKGKKQPKQLNKYTGGSWQTEKATCGASFRLRVMC